MSFLKHYERSSKNQVAITVYPLIQAHGCLLYNTQRTKLTERQLEENFKSFNRGRKKQSAFCPFLLQISWKTPSLHLYKHINQASMNPKSKMTFTQKLAPKSSVHTCKPVLNWSFFEYINSSKRYVKRTSNINHYSGWLILLLNFKQIYTHTHPNVFF